MNEDRIMKVTDENGNEIDMYILFTTTLEEFNKNYIFYIDYKNNAERVYVSSFDEDGHLHNVENEEEWSILNDALNDYLENSNDEEFDCSNCQGDCDSCEGNS